MSSSACGQLASRGGVGAPARMLHSAAAGAAASFIECHVADSVTETTHLLGRYLIMDPHAVSSKATAQHLTRCACLYVRRASVAQATADTESVCSQLGLRQRAAELGWADDRIVTIDCDLGRSAARTAGRVGYEALLSQIAGHQLGIVLALDASRLTRCPLDWLRLLRLCRCTQSLILLGDTVYDPTAAGDRQLLRLAGAEPVPVRLSRSARRLPRSPLPSFSDNLSLMEVSSR